VQGAMGGGSVRDSECGSSWSPNPSPGAVRLEPVIIATMVAVLARLSDERGQKGCEWRRATLVLSDGEALFERDADAERRRLEVDAVHGLLGEPAELDGADGQERLPDEAHPEAVERTRVSERDREVQCGMPTVGSSMSGRSLAMMRSTRSAAGRRNPGERLGADVRGSKSNIIKIRVPSHRWYPQYVGSHSNAETCENE
jgi:hypothetical protein